MTQLNMLADKITIDRSRVNNMTDIANLKYECIVDGRLEYVRQKTKRLINIPLQEEAKKILQKYSNQGATLNDYIFPILIAVPLKSQKVL